MALLVLRLAPAGAPSADCDQRAPWLLLPALSRNWGCSVVNAAGWLIRPGSPGIPCWHEQTTEFFGFVPLPEEIRLLKVKVLTTALCIKASAHGVASPSPRCRGLSAGVHRSYQHLVAHPHF